MGNGTAIGTSTGGVAKDGLLGMPGSALKGVPLDSGIATPAGELADPFEEFNSVTLHHDGEDGSSSQAAAADQGGGGGHNRKR